MVDMKVDVVLLAQRLGEERQSEQSKLHGAIVVHPASGTDCVGGGGPSLSCRVNHR
jgi:hypothetical protein